MALSDNDNVDNNIFHDTLCKVNSIDWGILWWNRRTQKKQQKFNIIFSGTCTHFYSSKNIQMCAPRNLIKFIKMELQNKLPLYLWSPVTNYSCRKKALTILVGSKKCFYYGIHLWLSCSAKTIEELKWNIRRSSS